MNLVLHQSCKLQGISTGGNGENGVLGFRTAEVFLFLAFHFSSLCSLGPLLLKLFYALFSQAEISNRRSNQLCLILPSLIKTQWNQALAAKSDWQKNESLFLDRTDCVQLMHD